MLEELASQAFWIGLAKIIGVNVILSGDNAVVIALAARSLPQRQQKQAVIWGAGAAVILRIILTIFAVALLTLPWLKIVGSLLLFWIGTKLLIPEDGEDNIQASDQLLAAIKTILIADLVMSLDNVIAVAAAAAGSYVLLILGLAISIPLVVFGATLLIKLMERFPVIITLGAGLIGWVAGEMLVADSALKGWLTAWGVEYRQEQPYVGGYSLELIAAAVGFVGVVVVGKWLAAKSRIRASRMPLAWSRSRPLRDLFILRPPGIQPGFGCRMLSGQRCRSIVD
jgi:YjbE family integral membrane protein